MIKGSLVWSCSACPDSTSVCNARHNCIRGLGSLDPLEALSEEEARFFLEQRWSHRVNAHSDDFTDQEAVAAILRITRGNIRLIERLMMQVEHVLAANQLQVVTK